MKRLATISGAAVLLAAFLSLAGCGESNNFGISVDLTAVCARPQGTTTGGCVSNPDVSMADNRPLFAELTVANRMSDDSGTGSSAGLTVRLISVEIDYRTPYGNPLPLRREQVAQNVAPGATATVPVTLFSYEQIEYIKDNPGLFPEYPFQVNLHVKVIYDTTGAATGSVQRLFSLEAVR